MSGLASRTSGPPVHDGPDQTSLPKPNSNRPASRRGGTPCDLHCCRVSPPGGRWLGGRKDVHAGAIVGAWTELRERLARTATPEQEASRFGGEHRRLEVNGGRDSRPPQRPVKATTRLEDGQGSRRRPAHHEHPRGSTPRRRSTLARVHQHAASSHRGRHDHRLPHRPARACRFRGGR